MYPSVMLLAVFFAVTAVSIPLKTSDANGQADTASNVVAGGIAKDTIAPEAMDDDAEREDDGVNEKSDAEAFAYGEQLGKKEKKKRNIGALKKKSRATMEALGVVGNACEKKYPGKDFKKMFACTRGGLIALEVSGATERAADDDEEPGDDATDEKRQAETPAYKFGKNAGQEAMEAIEKKMNEGKNFSTALKEALTKADDLCHNKFAQKSEEMYESCYSGVVAAFVIAANKEAMDDDAELEDDGVNKKRAGTAFEYGEKVGKEQEKQRNIGALEKKKMEATMNALRALAKACDEKYPGRDKQEGMNFGCRNGGLKVLGVPFPAVPGAAKLDAKAVAYGKQVGTKQKEEKNIEALQRKQMDATMEALQEVATACAKEYGDATEEGMNCNNGGLNVLMPFPNMAE